MGIYQVLISWLTACKCIRRRLLSTASINSNFHGSREAHCAIVALNRVSVTIKHQGDGKHLMIRQLLDGAEHFLCGPCHCWRERPGGSRIPAHPIGSGSAAANM